MHKIYSLSFFDNIFYIGVTSKELNERVYAHIIENLKTDGHLFEFLKEQIKIEEIESTSRKDYATKLETYWINQFYQWGFKLYNRRQLNNDSKYKRKITKIIFSKDQIKFMTEERPTSDCGVLAKLLGLCPAHTRQMMLGTFSPRYEYYVQICDFYGFNKNELLFQK